MATNMDVLQLLHELLLTQQTPARPVGRRLCRSLDMVLRSVIGYVEGRGKESEKGETDKAVPQLQSVLCPWVLKKLLIGLRLWTV